MTHRLLRLFTVFVILGLAAAGTAAAQECSGTIIGIITGTAVYEVTAGGQDRTVPLRFTAIWAKRPSGVEFVSWQSTGIPK